jgi:hypothetical protein
MDQIRKFPDADLFRLPYFERLCWPCCVFCAQNGGVDNYGIMIRAYIGPDPLVQYSYIARMEALIDRNP